MNQRWEQMRKYSERKDEKKYEKKVGGKMRDFVLFIIPYLWCDT
ncbi:MAG: hypothetical protein ACRECH_14095 [Nitrososphaerales archaeon]